MKAAMLADSQLFNKVGNIVNTGLDWTRFELDSVSELKIFFIPTYDF